MSERSNNDSDDERKQSDVFQRDAIHHESSPNQTDASESNAGTNGPSFPIQEISTNIETTTTTLPHLEQPKDDNTNSDESGKLSEIMATKDSCDNSIKRPQKAASSSNVSLEFKDAIRLPLLHSRISTSSGKRPTHRVTTSTSSSSMQQSYRQPVTNSNSVVPIRKSVKSSGANPRRSVDIGRSGLDSDSDDGELLNSDDETEKKIMDTQVGAVAVFSNGVRETRPILGSLNLSNHHVAGSQNRDIHLHDDDDDGDEVQLPRQIVEPFAASVMDATLVSTRVTSSQSDCVIPNLPPEVPALLVEKLEEQMPSQRKRIIVWSTLCILMTIGIGVGMGVGIVSKSSGPTPTSTVPVVLENDLQLTLTNLEILSNWMGRYSFDGNPKLVGNALNHWNYHLTILKALRAVQDLELDFNDFGGALGEILDCDGCSQTLRLFCFVVGQVPEEFANLTALMERANK
ncbi:hypothetical protein IV203_009999 [Nitzschia inconspicua]|uniref:Uncharacterized protein n=1 Tax=Nitzschia inconspicua TaxID=303405 RepID=A0A9K3PMP2_9STRA|nr:hypothetical protein IV203_009999 [Nitzschia inconspicua]